MNRPHISLIISVYNKPVQLRFIFAACSRQTFKDFEIVVADDGSGQEVKEVIDEARVTYEFPIHHIWQEDLLWRKNMILNKAITASSADYLVFIDGDCIPHRKFLEDHWNNREEKTLVGGRRAEMSERWSRKVSLETIMNGEFERIGVREWIDGLSHRAVAVEAGLRFQNSFLQSTFHSRTRGLLGSNFSIEKKHLETINGFDEEYDGPGCGEDSDIEFRLSLIGVKHKLLRHLAIQFHMYHPSTKASAKSLERFQEAGRTKKIRCEKGLNQYSVELQGVFIRQCNCRITSLNQYSVELQVP